MSAGLGFGDGGRMSDVIGFTKGPWMVSPYNLTGIFDEKKRPIAVAYEGVHSFDIELEERKANARLISAAPELYEALHSLKHEIEFLRTVGAIAGGSFEALAELEGALAKARAALAKARGES